MQVPATVDHRQAAYMAEHDRRSTELSESSLLQLPRSSVARFACHNLPQNPMRQGSRHGGIPVAEGTDGRTRFAQHRNGTAVAVPHVHRHGFQFGSAAAGSDTAGHHVRNLHGPFVRTDHTNSAPVQRAKVSRSLRESPDGARASAGNRALSSGHTLHAGRDTLLAGTLMTDRRWKGCAADADAPDPERYIRFIKAIALEPIPSGCL
jgi:hypothetical protein